MKYKYFKKKQEKKNNKTIIFTIFGFMLLLISPAFPNEMQTKDEQNNVIINSFSFFLGMIGSAIEEQGGDIQIQKETKNKDIVFHIKKETAEIEVTFVLNSDPRKIVTTFPNAQKDEDSKFVYAIITYLAVYNMCVGEGLPDKEELMEDKVFSILFGTDKKFPKISKGKNIKIGTCAVTTKLDKGTFEVYFTEMLK